MKTAILQTVLVRENAAAFLYAHAWSKPEDVPEKPIDRARLMRRADAEGWKHVRDGDFSRFPNASCVKAALDSAGFVEGVDYKDGKPTECLYL